ncbi:CDGSH iron-sulfur domain-containing protein [Streptomyces sp. NPDC015346]|uniref:CDGSH iron-sulfur domain-containing protein n=1 Tax=Streptomyces sp. NPDC015346 TaxID=3364954 RepID=UPI003701D42F
MSVQQPETEETQESEAVTRAGATRITPVRGGPLLVEGPVEIVMPDGTVEFCDRPTVALCMCRRSLRYPFCDTSHRPRIRRERRDDRRDERRDDRRDGQEE